MQATRNRTLRTHIRAFAYRWSDELIALAVFILLIVCSLDPTGA